jgi:hypothetical protein
MRPRDIRAIWFCVITTVIVLLGSAVLLSNVSASFALGAAYAVFIATRPRMQRVRRRLRGDSNWGDYYQN